MRYLAFVATAVLLAVALVACSGAPEETFVLEQGSIPTPAITGTRIPRAVVTPIPRGTVSPPGTPRPTSVVTPTATATPGGTAAATRTPTVTATGTISPTGTVALTPTSGTPTPTQTATGTPTTVGTPVPTAKATLTPTPASTTTTATPGPSRQVESAAGSLSQKVRAFREAVEAKDTGAMLRLQRELLEEVDKAEGSIKEDRSQFAERLRSAIRSIREGATGDAGKLDAAARELREATGKPEEDDRARDQGTRTPGLSQTELRSMAESLARRVESFDDARRSRSAENTLRQQKELLEEINRVEQAIKNDNTRRGEQIRSALQSIRNGLGSEDSKLDEARQALRKALED